MSAPKVTVEREEYVLLCNRDVHGDMVFMGRPLFLRPPGAAHSAAIVRALLDGMDEEARHMALRLYDVKAIIDLRGQVTAANAECERLQNWLMVAAGERDEARASLEAEKSAHEKTRAENLELHQRCNEQQDVIVRQLREKGAASADRDSLRARVTELEKAKTGPDDASPDFNKETRRLLDECVGGDKGTVVGYGFEALYQLVRGLLEGKLKAEQRVVELEQQIKDSHDEHCKQLREWRAAGDANRAAREEAEQRVGELEAILESGWETMRQALGLPVRVNMIEAAQKMQQRLAKSEAELAAVRTKLKEQVTAAYNDGHRDGRWFEQKHHTDGSGRRDVPDDEPAPEQKAGATEPVATIDTWSALKASAELLDAGPVSFEEARSIADRFNASHWGRKNRERARYSIPADPKRDDDIRLNAFIDQCEDAIVSLKQQVAISRAELERWRPVVEKAEKAADSHRPVVCHGTGGCAAISGTLEDLALIQAVDALRAGEKGGG